MTRKDAMAENTALGRCAELAERLAVVEARMLDDEQDREKRRVELDKTLAHLQKTLERQAREMERYKGVVGGISLAVSVLWAGIAFFKEQILAFLGGR